MTEPTGPVRFRGVVERVPDIITVLDVAGTVRYVSPALERIAGYAPEDVVGRIMFGFVHPDDLANVRNAFATAVQNPGITGPIELRLRHRDGSWRVLEALGQSFLDDAGAIRWVVSFRDLTERTAVTSRGLQAAAPLAGGVAYEFNDLLTIIIARSDLVLRRVPADDEIRRNVDLIQRSAQRAADLLQPFLTGGADAAPAASAAGSSPGGGGALRGSETVLLVDDEDGIRRLLTETLGMSGYSVLEARHGGEALEICQRHHGPIHVLVTDVVMPQMSGQELAQRVRPMRPDMKVLYVSGYTDISVSRHGVIDSDSAFLPKPFMPQALAQKIRDMLDRPVAP
jgi:PAS domain S-box-containing protein